MKLIKVLCFNTIEIVKATFTRNQVDALEMEPPLPSEDDNRLSDLERENKNQKNLIELAYQYQVNICIKWILLMVTLFLFGYSAYLAIDKNITCVITCITAFIVHRLYVNSKILSGMKRSLIEFSLEI